MTENELKIEASDEMTLLKYADMAELMNIDVSKARDIVRAGGVPLVDMGTRTHRVRLADVKRFINAGGFRSNV